MWSEGLPFRQGLLGVSADRTARWDHTGGLEFVLRRLVCKVMPVRSQEGTGQPRELSRFSDWLQSFRQRRASAWELWGPVCSALRRGDSSAPNTKLTIA